MNLQQREKIRKTCVYLLKLKLDKSTVGHPRDLLSPEDGFYKDATET